MSKLKKGTPTNFGVFQEYVKGNKSAVVYDKVNNNTRIYIIEVSKLFEV